jgi:hypothetical protein
MTDRAVRDMLWLLALSAALWLLHRYGRVLPDTALLAVGVPVTALLTFGLFWRRRVRRRAFIAAYVAPGSPLGHWLRGGWLLAASQSVVAVVLALVLIIALVRLRDPRVWIVLVAAGPVLVLLQRGVRGLLRAHASAVYLPALSWRVSVLLTAALMLASLVIMTLQQAYPAFAGVSLERAVWHLADQEQARGEVAQLLMQMAAAKDALRLWLAQQLMPTPGTSLLQLLGWLLVLADELLFVWSYLLLCQALLVAVSSNDRFVS